MNTTRLFIHNKPRSAPEMAVRGFFMGGCKLCPWAAAVALFALYSIIGRLGN